MKQAYIIFLFMLVAWIIPNHSYAQEPGSASDTNTYMRVFIDCEECDMDNLKQDFSSVNYVRDRKLSNVHVQVSSLPNGSGGKQFTFCFFGYQEFEGMNDTLIAHLAPNSTVDEQRDLLNQYIQLGLFRYMIKTPLCKNLNVSCTNVETTQNDTVKDKWNYWVFSIEGSGWMNGQSIVKNYNLYGQTTAKRITTEGKTEFFLGINFNKNVFEIDDTTTIIGKTETRWLEGRHVWSLNEHWSAGIGGSYYSSIFENISHSFSGGPALEYNIYPYSESSTRMIYFTYLFKPIYRKYHETTILFRDEQYLMNQSLSFSTRLIKPWGQLNSTLSFSHMLHDFSINSTSCYLNAQFRLFKGLNLTISGYFARLRNLINIPLVEASEEDILLGRVQLPTNMSYWTNIGLTYTFGSIYNNIVNPRLD